MNLKKYMKKLKRLTLKYFYWIVAALVVIELLSMWFSGFLALSAIMLYAFLLIALSWIAVSYSLEVKYGTSN